MSLKTLLVVTLLTASSLALSSEEVIVTIISDYDSDIGKLYVNTNQFGEVKELKLQVIGKPEKPFLPISQLENGIVLKESKGFEVVRMYSCEFRADVGGRIFISYMKNLKGRREEVSFIVENVNGSWRLVDDKDDSIVNILMVKVNKALGLTIGIDDIVVKEKESKEEGDDIEIYMAQKD